MKKIFTLLFLFSTLTTSASAQQLVSATPISTYNVSQIHNILAAYGWSSASMDLHAVKSYRILYRTIDTNGDSTTASGAVYIPQIDTCNYLPLLAYHHGTEFEQTHVPSLGYYNGQGLFYSTTGYIAVLPDYLGMGSNAGIHPYQHWRSQATSAVDLMRAVREFLPQNGGLQDNGQVFLTGYSQGGHAAMSTHKYIQQNASSEFNVVASAPLSGAHYLSGAQVDFIFDGDSTYAYNAFLPYILGSFQLVYGNIYNSFDAIYDSPYDSQIQTYLNDGNYTFNQWSAMLPANYYHFMQDSVLQQMLSNPAHPINVALRDNDLHNWVPLAPVRMIYCSSDDVVNPQNSIAARDTMQALGATDVDAIDIYPAGNHSSCFPPANEFALAWFDSLKADCNTVLGLQQVPKESFKLYPNPTSDRIFLQASSGIRSVRISDLNGKTFPLALKESSEISLSALENGMYIIEILTNDGQRYRRSVLKTE